MNNHTATFIQYNTDQLILPMDFSDWIPETHIARLVHQVVENLEDDCLLEAYPGGGRSAYHPKMMLKLVLYAYTQKVTSGRQMAKMCQDNLPMIWLTGHQQPDFNTINRFRSQRLKTLIAQIFEAMVLQMADQGLFEWENYFLDGTKIEANANRYTFVWKKSTLNYQGKLSEKIRDFLEEADTFCQIELEEPEVIEALSDLTELSQSILERVATQDTPKEKAVIDTESVTQVSDTLQRVNTSIQNAEVSKEVQRKFGKITKDFQTDFVPRMQKYDHYLEIMGERNSYSKTDPDATFMRLKEDHMRNGQLKPAYNVQIGTNQQYILHYTIHPNPTDTRTLIPHLQSLEACHYPKPTTLIADAGYGSEPNYDYCYNHDYLPLIPYGKMYYEQKRKVKEDPKRWVNWTYDEGEDCFINPSGIYYPFTFYSQRTDHSGFVRSYKIYQREDWNHEWSGEEIKEAEWQYRIYYNPTFEAYKAKARELLLERKETRELYGHRKTEPETAFGNLKANLAFKRFRLRGIEKVIIEFGLAALAHNLIKWGLTIQKVLIY